MVDQVSRTGWRRCRVVLVAGLAVLAGCDKIQSLMPSKPPASGAHTAAMPMASSAQPVQPVVPQTDLIAKINDRVLSKRDIELTIQDLKNTTEALGRTWKPLSEQDLKDLAEGLIMAELRAQDALARGVDRQTDVQQRLQHRLRTFFAQEWVSWQLSRAAVTQKEVDDFYATNQAGFREPEQIRLRQLVFASEEQAKTALVKLLEGSDMATIASTSVRPEAATGPLVDQWVLRSNEKAAFAPNNDKVRDLRDPVLEQAAFAIDKIGGTSSYVKGADSNYHIFQLVERKPGRQRPLVEVSDNIRNFLQLRKIEQATEELKTKAKIERAPENLKSVEQ